MVIVGELHKWEEDIPIVLLFPDEDLEVLFQFLVDPFGLSISLWMVGHRCCGFYPKQLI